MKEVVTVEKEQNTKSFGFVPPGISLTETPKKFQWDKPPRLNTPEEALSYVKNILENESTMETIIDLLEVGTTPKFIATSIVKAGFAGNLWNPDVAELIKFPVAALVTLIGISAKVDIKMDDTKPDRMPLKDAKIELKNKKKRKVKEEDSDEDTSVVKIIKGIMARK